MRHTIPNLVNNEVTQTSQLEAWHRTRNAENNLIETNCFAKLSGIFDLFLDYVNITTRLYVDIYRQLRLHDMHGVRIRSAIHHHYQIQR